MAKTNKVYVLVRADLSKSQQAVQAGHALLELAREFAIPKNETIVLLRARDQDHLWNLFDTCERSCIFREPDIGMEATAVASIDWCEEFDGMRLA